jgi:transcriptional regulator with XRE-family HTH domain
VKSVLVRFGEIVRETRLRKGISQERLAELANLHRTYVSGVERGERNISLVNIERIAHALGVEMAEIMPTRNARR